MQIFVLTNNLRCFDETDVRTSQKTTYAQFKIYRTIFIDEIGVLVFLLKKHLIPFATRRVPTEDSDQTARMRRLI